MLDNTTHQFKSTATNMVSAVENTIDGYRMGPIRALAQEPVQNSKDAALTASQPVRVEFELHERALLDGQPSWMLTITDSGTSGLGGPILGHEELTNLGSLLPRGHDWTRFEGHGYTKSDEDALGSRGQGKAAFLYHAEPPESALGAKRMVILYDTLLDSGEYRLGVRYANPSDVTKVPPYTNDEARAMIQATSFQIDQGLEFPVALAPLGEVGTRIIIPYLSDVAREAVTSGELARWLQMCWWRSVQVGQLHITVTESGKSEPVEVPTWWRGEPWRNPSDENNTYVKENIALTDDSDFKIKRIVLSCHDGIPEYEPIVSAKEPEFEGIQLMRNGQWIETLGRVEDWFTRTVPAELRPRFRGFVEFDRLLDRELRSGVYESPQHDDFRRQHRLVRDIIEVVGRQVAEYSRLSGWSEEPEPPGEAKRKEREVLRRVVELFTEPADDGEGGGGKNGADSWDVALDATYPTQGTTRVNWGETIRNVTAICTTDAEFPSNSVNVRLTRVDPDKKTKQIAELPTSFDVDGIARVDFGDLSCLRGRAKPGALSLGCEDSGMHRLRATVVRRQEVIASASRAVYVEVDPPKPPDKPISLQLTAKNAIEPSRQRVNSGENLRIFVGVRNRSPEGKSLVVDASLIASRVPGHLVMGEDVPGSLQLLHSQRIDVKGIENAGDTAIPVTVFNDDVRLLDDLEERGGGGRWIVLAPGRHRVQVDLRTEGGEIVASASRVVLFEIDPPSDDGGGLPFELEPMEDDYATTGQALPTWSLQSETADVPAKLRYSTTHPLYRAAMRSDQGSAGANLGTRAYLAEICSDALVDWMLEPYLESNDASRFDAIESRRSRSPQWEYLADRIESFRDRCAEANGNSASDLAHDRRVVVANMVRAFQVEVG